VMSNLGLERHLNGLGLELVRTPVGDRYVLEHMRAHGYNIGGEPSGHIILSDYTTTGDGFVAALQVLAVVKRGNKPVSELCHRFEPLPQVLKNVRYQKGKPLEHAQVRSAIASAEKAHGIARVLVNCAGIGGSQRIVGKEGVYPLAKFARIINVNLIGTFNVLRLFAERLLTEAPLGEERGVIINTASVAAYEGQIGQIAYSASKGGVVGLTLPAARDLAQHKIRVNTIAPGLFLTPLLMGLSEEARKSLGAQVPHPARLGDAAEYGQLAVHIVENAMLNGETIRLDGAIRMAPR